MLRGKCQQQIDVFVQLFICRLKIKCGPPSYAFILATKRIVQRCTFAGPQAGALLQYTAHSNFQTDIQVGYLFENRLNYNTHKKTFFRIAYFQQKGITSKNFPFLGSSTKTAEKALELKQPDIRVVFPSIDYLS